MGSNSGRSYRRTADERGLVAEYRGNNTFFCKNQTAEGRARAEIQDQANLDARPLQVIEKLHLVNGNDPICDLRFNNDFALNDEVGPIVAHVFAEKVHGDWNFSFALHTVPFEQDWKRPLVNRFNVSVPQNPMHVKEGRNDGLRHIGMEQFDSRARSSQNISPRMSARVSANVRGSSGIVSGKRPLPESFDLRPSR